MATMAMSHEDLQGSERHDNRLFPYSSVEWTGLLPDVPCGSAGQRLQ